MSKFKERLWRDLEREHGSELAQISRPATGRARARRRWPRPRARRRRCGIREPSPTPGATRDFPLGSVTMVAFTIVAGRVREGGTAC
jgi:hypothetical protein